MTRFSVTVQVEADTIQDAINKIIYPGGEPLAGVLEVWAERWTA